MIVNITKKTIISKKYYRLKNLEKISGLIGRKQKVVVFKTRFGIHTFLLKSPIDVIVLDKYSKAVILKCSLKPNRIFLWNIKYDTVIELPENYIKNSKTELNDFLKVS